MPSIDVGVYIPQIAFRFEDLVDRAGWADELGLHSFWLMDHLYPPGLPNQPSFEAFTLAAALLARTSRIRLGHMVTCNNFRHPALVGKMVSTLEAISGGRFILGIGSGSVPAEHDQVGLPWGSFTERTERLAESLEILTSMLGQERTTFEGRHYVVKDLPNLPQPQRRPEVLVGGGGARTLALAARYADIWNCATYDLAHLRERVHALREACASVEREFSSIRLSLEAVLVTAETDEAVDDALALAERRYGGPGFGLTEAGFIGTPQRIAERIRAFAAEGITLFVFFLHDRGTRRTLELLGEQIVPALSD